jgi:hypothetical protein
MKQAILIAGVLVLSAVGALAAERAWQKGVLNDLKVERPKVNFGVGTRDPNSAMQMPPAIRETRTYIIDTDEFRYILTESTTTAMPAFDTLVGEEVEFAIEKNTAYLRDAKGKERKLSVSKKVAKDKL